MSTVKFTSDHEWIRFESDGHATIGITDYAQDQLGDIVYVELPEIGTKCSAGEQLMVIESVKAVGEIKAPVSGTVTAVNERLVEEPETVNNDPSKEGWLISIALDDQHDNGGESDGLLDEAAYDALVKSL